MKDKEQDFTFEVSTVQAYATQMMVQRQRVRSGCIAYSKMQ